ncbi:hypothetical protein ACQ0MK_10205 [Thalassospira lucentensis]|uniref:hypothetical protein n=1 Tax=Thalassospira lucentensis TaxID=168935 RepID=UPI003D2E9DA6
MASQAKGTGAPPADEEHWYQSAWGNIDKQFLADGYETADDLNAQGDGPYDEGGEMTEGET